MRAVVTRPVPENLPTLGVMPPRNKRDIRPIMTIINGVDAYAHQYPWQVSLQMKSEGSHFCGGSLISKCHVLCAAHCFCNNDEFQMRPKEIRIVYGSHLNTVGANSSAKTANCKRLIKHSGFVDVCHDIGILQLDKCVEFSDSVQTVCLPIQSGVPKCNFKGPATLTGFGLTNEENRESTKKLKAGRVKIISKEDCKRGLKTDYFRPETMLCQANATTGACYGDSGGPLISRTDDGRAIQRGVTSWVLGSCGKGDYPSTVFTDICAYSDWMVKVLVAYPCD
ncbi:Suppressor of tumorigenicity 14 -like protein [Halotydeus destructor]|nr:Suppressor of tumorigenicity 14 -like protein [Halotydeus destructor]